MMGFVVSDPTVLSELAPSTFYSFLSGTPAAPGGGYITDASMTSPEACEAYCNGAPTCSTFYYQYEFTNSSRMVAASIEPRWMHKCQLNLPLLVSPVGDSCGSPFAGDTNDWDEFAGRVSAAGAKP